MSGWLDQWRRKAVAYVQHPVPGGRVLSFRHDSSGNLTGLTDAANFTRTLGYGGGHHPPTGLIASRPP
jgi:YD repeat-containing protein